MVLATATTSTSSVIAAVAALVAALALVLAVAQLSLIRREHFRLERRQLEMRMQEQATLQARFRQHLETEHVWVELLSRHLGSQVSAEHPSASRPVDFEAFSLPTAIRARQLEFLARKRIENVAVADSQAESSREDMSFAAGAAEMLGRNIAAREEAT